ncbi:MAG TPA: ABC transporter substrate-binding protein [Stellaceae bacterium]|nr:ABC transporter substrate-binding protein [Stellaceae bacterium]
MRAIYRGRCAAGGLLLTAVLLLAVAGPAMASEITQPIEQLDARLLEIMKAGKDTPFEQRYTLLAPAVIGAIDLDAILQGGVGSTWDTLKPDEKAALKTAFQRYSTATYVANFDEYGGEKFELTPPADAANPVVRVKIVPGKPGDDMHTLGYTMRQTGGKWKAINITVDGYISQSVVQQAQIKALLIVGGIDGLYARLQQKTADLSGGTMK